MGGRRTVRRMERKEEGRLLNLSIEPYNCHHCRFYMAQPQSDISWPDLAITFQKLHGPLTSDVFNTGPVSLDSIAYYMVLDLPLLSLSLLLFLFSHPY